MNLFIDRTRWDHERSLRSGVQSNPLNHMNQPTKAQWASHIGALIRNPIADVPFDQSNEQQRIYIESFADEYGNRRTTDKPFLAYLFGLNLNELPSTANQSLDEQIWWMLQTGSPTANDIQSLIEPTGALVTGSDQLAIEYRTMVELSSLHALWIHAARLDSQVLIDRCLDAATWHTRELQPDNAINRPWATQVFIALAHQSPDPEVSNLAHLHAQTLIHNASISFGAPDILSALILRDVAEHL